MAETFALLAFKKQGLKLHRWAEHVREVVMASPLMGSMAAKDCLTKALLAGYQALDQQLAAARPRKVRAGIGVLLVGGMLSDHLGYHPPLDLTERLLRNSGGGGVWEAARALLDARAGAAAAALGGRLHVAGGTGVSQAPLASAPSPNPSPNPSPAQPYPYPYP